ncbi:Cache sensor-containing signal transduction histidine kinase [Aliarcobacter faecis]|uniref:sensor histidine kinase n=1 Tax=Aliarcobacter faecis TaxID=1564138 RepID=UPI00047A9A25|nr:cache domain-containing protein [Aliarcobacter faecis]QKF72928.1 Cache sensor-containing signal transduction histidine kinase [Aliarcobacter faecis]
MDKEKEEQLLKIIKYSPIVLILFITSVLVFFLYLENKRVFLNSKEELEQKFYLQNADLIKDEVNRAYFYIKYIQENAENNLKNSIKSRVYEAHAIASNLYEKYKNIKSKDEILELIKVSLEKIRYNDGRGYFYIDDALGNKLLLPLDKKDEGKNFLNHVDDKGYAFVKTIVDTIDNKGERFDEYYWKNPVTNLSSRKIAFYKYFEPLNFAIGTGEYFDEYNENVQKRVLDYVNSIKFGKNGYIFIMTNDGICLSEEQKIVHTKYKMEDILASREDNIEAMIKIANSNNDNFYRYEERYNNSNIDYKVNKISYVKAISGWNWIIGSSFYEDDVNFEIIEMKKRLDSDFDINLKNILLASIILIIFLLIISFYVSKYIEKKFIDYKDELGSRQALLFQQSKMATMGEMIRNIAHQWRQPLSVITAATSGMLIQKEMGNLTDEFFVNSAKKINSSASYLSQTIDDFRNFFSPNKEKEKFMISHTLSKTLDLISVQLNTKDIFIIKDVQNIEVFSYENELIQALINILNNARDELINKDYDKYIFIDINKNNNQLKIVIKDNAGGVRKENLSKIFNPYFTTKEKTQGTGIGLYITQEIILQLNGEISVRNVDFNYNKEKYRGAEFTITLNL